MQVGRLPASRCGSRSAANGSHPSFFEPGKLFTNEKTQQKQVPSFDKQTGRVPLYLSGMRGAPSRAMLGEDNESGLARPQVVSGHCECELVQICACYWTKTRTYGALTFPMQHQCFFPSCSPQLLCCATLLKARHHSLASHVEGRRTGQCLEV